jgi:parallel beta-helix repeat protein
MFPSSCPSKRLMLFSLTLLLYGVTSVYAAIPITDCTVIDSPGVYELQNDIINATTGCITISSSNVTFDGRGHVIDGGMNFGPAVLIKNIIPPFYITNVTVKNLEVRNWEESGIISIGWEDGSIENNNVSGVIGDPGCGICLYASNVVSLKGNIVSSNDAYGILLETSSFNLLDNNILEENLIGVVLRSDSNVNELSNNIVRQNERGVLISNSIDNTLRGNRIYGNGVGIGMYYAEENSIYNNFFNNSENFMLIDVVSNIWNTTKTPGTSIVGGPYLGGNYWGTPTGDGFSDICSDADGDWICDSSYVFDRTYLNVDYLPLTIHAVPPPQCSDGIDNDGDGKVDYPEDPGCTSPDDDDERDTVSIPEFPSAAVPVILGVGGYLLLRIRRWL